MAVEIARLVHAASGMPRLSVASLDAILRDQRLLKIERGVTVDASSESPFACAFAGYLAPLALSSRLWTMKTPVPLSWLRDVSRNIPGTPELARLNASLAKAHRCLRRQARRNVQGALASDVHRAVCSATQRIQTGGAKRVGEIAFRGGSRIYLMPSPGEAERYLKKFNSTWNLARIGAPVAGPLFAALHLVLLHPFVDGNGRAMRAFAAAFGRGEIEALCNAIACFMQPRQKLWNFTLPLALDGDRDALWLHVESSLEKAKVLRAAVVEAASAYRERLALDDAGLRKPCDVALVRSAVLDDRTFRYLIADASSRTAMIMRKSYVPRTSSDGAREWINSGVNALVDGLTGPLVRQI